MNDEQHKLTGIWVEWAIDSVYPTEKLDNRMIIKLLENIGYKYNQRQMCSNSSSGFRFEVAEIISEMPVQQLMDIIALLSTISGVSAYSLYKKLNKSHVVWITSLSRKVYHASPECRYIISKPKVMIPGDKAKEIGLTPCKRCHDKH